MCRARFDRTVKQHYIQGFVCSV